MKISLTTSCGCQHANLKRNLQNTDTHPDEDLALVTAHDGLDVVLHDRNQGVLVVDLGDPAGELAVPDEGVAVNELAVGLSPVDEVVGTAELEVATRRLSSIELHRVLWGDLAEVSLGQVGDVAIVEGALVTASAPVPEYVLMRLTIDMFPILY